MAEENNGGDPVPNRALKDYSIPNVGVSSTRRPPIQANNFEIKPVIIQMIQYSIQFGGLANDDPNLHIANFLEICDTFKHNGVTDDAIRLWLFPFSLNNKAKAWLTSLPSGTITTWDGLVRIFLLSISHQQNLQRWGMISPIFCSKIKNPFMKLEKGSRNF